MNIEQPGLDGRAAVVTGAGRGLGRSYALGLAAAGAAVMVNDMDRSCAEETVREIESRGGRAAVDSGSVVDPAAAQQLVENCMGNFGRLDILVCNAGIVRYGSIVDAPLEDLQAQMDVSLWGSVHPIRAAWRHMVEQKFGRIILTTSRAGLWGHGQMAGYAMSKSALIGLGRSIRQEVPEGCDMEINLVAPSAVTRLSEAAVPPELHQRLSPDNVSPLVVFLASASCKQSGMIFNVGGGNIRQVRILESAAAPLSAAGISALPSELSDYAGLPEAKDMIEAGTHIVPDLANHVPVVG